MRLGEWVFRYCERGTSISAFAEPINVASNLAFLIVACLLWRDRRSPFQRPIAVGAGTVAMGSTAFHVVPARWAEVADVVPIGLLMGALGWLLLINVIGLASRRTRDLLTALAVAMCIAAWAMASVGCAAPLITASSRAPSALRPMSAICLNGGWTYVPVGLALWLIAAMQFRDRSPAAPWIIAGAGAFSLALTARSLDLSWCAPPLTFHALWHLAAAATIYALARAIAVTGRPITGRGL